MDFMSVNSFLRDLDDPHFRVYKIVIVPNRFHYGIKLNGEAGHYLGAFKEFLKTTPIENRLEKTKVDQGTFDHSTEAIPTMEAIKLSDVRNFLYQKTLKVTGFALISLATGGLVYEAIQKWLKRNVRGADDVKGGQQKARPSDAQLKREEIRAQMRQLLEEFHGRFQKTYLALKLKHRKELLKVRKNLHFASVNLEKKLSNES
ncbi:uncharacterized protein LOC111344169 [Stylophora pistillata]|uniref:uncharacterized protein LOC111344169 n=1 Tax=Stylophora pistillata TaxID=50429 RepID=UPI000C03E854|nr:uncharacterized protein LOC111344169 [Stylophora pistillata]